MQFIVRGSDRHYCYGGKVTIKEVKQAMLAKSIFSFNGDTLSFLQDSRRRCQAKGRDDSSGEASLSLEATTPAE